jgi:hypothetical protein
MTPRNNSKKEKTKQWINKHNNPNFEYIKSLSVNENPKALELWSIANKLNLRDNHEI